VEVVFGPDQIELERFFTRSNRTNHPECFCDNASVETEQNGNDLFPTSTFTPEQEIATQHQPLSQAKQLAALLDVSQLSGPSRRRDHERGGDRVDQFQVQKRVEEVQEGVAHQLAQQVQGLQGDHDQEPLGRQSGQEGSVRAHDDQQIHQGVEWKLEEFAQL
jgi:hypothetical protein